MQPAKFVATLGKCATGVNLITRDGPEAIRQLVGSGFPRV
jgi:hypothetical protein